MLGHYPECKYVCRYLSAIRMAVFVPSEYMHTGRYLTNLLYSLFVMAEVFCNTAEEDRPGLNGFMSFFHSLFTLECFF